MFIVPFLQSFTIQLFVLFFWAGAIVIGAKRWAGSDGGEIHFGLGPEVFRLHLNRFRYGIHLVPWLLQLNIGDDSDKRVWSTGMLAGSIGCLILSALLAAVGCSLLATRQTSPPSQATIVRAVDPGSAAAKAGIRRGDQLPSIDTLADLAAKDQVSTVQVLRGGQQVPLKIRPEKWLNRIQPLGLTLVAPAAATRLARTPWSTTVGFSGAPDHPFGLQVRLVLVAAATSLELGLAALVMSFAQATGRHWVPVILIMLLAWRAEAPWLVILLWMIWLFCGRAMWPKSTFNPFTVSVLYGCFWGAFSWPVGHRLLTQLLQHLNVGVVWTV